MLFDDDLLGDINSLAHLDHASPFKTKSSMGAIPVNEPLRKANTMMPGKQSYMVSNKQQPTLVHVESGETLKGVSEKEDLDEDLINEIE